MLQTPPDAEIPIRAVTEPVTLETIDRKLTRIETRMVKLMLHLGLESAVTPGPRRDRP